MNIRNYLKMLFGKDDLSTKHGEWFVRAKHRLASHPDTSAEVLDKLSQKRGSVQLLERVAEHSQASPVTLERLSIHETPEIRSAVADNKNADIHTIEFLAADESPDVRYVLAENAHTPTKVLKSLANDENPYVNLRARQTLNKVRHKRFADFMNALKKILNPCRN